MMAPVNPDSGLLFMTAYAAKESEAMRWAKEITEIYDKAPSNKGVKTLASIATFVFLYRYLAPVAITKPANRIGEYVGKKVDEKKQRKAQESIKTA